MFTFFLSLKLWSFHWTLSIYGVWGKTQVLVPVCSKKSGSSSDLVSVRKLLSWLLSNKQNNVPIKLFLQQTQSFWLFDTKLLNPYAHNSAQAESLVFPFSAHKHEYGYFSNLNFKIYIYISHEPLLTLHYKPR